jgi:acetoin utilization deacetylase AcuC-like enzyme
MVNVYYSPAQSVATNDSFSPSAGKPAQLVEQWRGRWGTELSVVEPEPISEDLLCLAHESEFVKDVLTCRIPNGFGNYSQEIAASLRWTNGSFVSATRHVLKHGGVACSPTSGFHHAGYNFAGAFCTFNGLMVAAVLAGQHHKRVGILDCDYHYGNGTQDIIDRLALSHIEHLTTGGFPRSMKAENFLERLPDSLQKMNVNLLLYQAGADAHVDDPLGGWMTTEQMRLRDKIVFDHCRRTDTPVVWNLAGGYQSDLQFVLDLHHQTMEECLKAFGSVAG